MELYLLLRLNLCGLFFGLVVSQGGSTAPSESGIFSLLPQLGRPDAVGGGGTGAASPAGNQGSLPSSQPVPRSLSAPQLPPLPGTPLSGRITQNTPTNMQVGLPGRQQRGRSSNMGQQMNNVNSVAGAGSGAQRNPMFNRGMPQWGTNQGNTQNNIQAQLRRQLNNNNNNRMQTFGRRTGTMQNNIGFNANGVQTRGTGVPTRGTGVPNNILSNSLNGMQTGMQMDNFRNPNNRVMSNNINNNNNINNMRGNLNTGIPQGMQIPGRIGQTGNTGTSSMRSNSVQGGQGQNAGMLSRQLGQGSQGVRNSMGGNGNPIANIINRNRPGSVSRNNIQATTNRNQFGWNQGNPRNGSPGFRQNIPTRFSQQSMANRMNGQSNQVLPNNRQGRWNQQQPNFRSGSGAAFNQQQGNQFTMNDRSQQPAVQSLGQMAGNLPMNGLQNIRGQNTNGLTQEQLLRLERNNQQTQQQNLNQGHQSGNGQNQPGPTNQNQPQNQNPQQGSTNTNQNPQEGSTQATDQTSSMNFQGQEARNSQLGSVPVQMESPQSLDFDTKSSSSTNGNLDTPHPAPNKLHATLVVSSDLAVKAFKVDSDLVGRLSPLLKTSKMNLGNLINDALRNILRMSSITSLATEPQMLSDPLNNANSGSGTPSSDSGSILIPAIHSQNKLP